VKQEEDKVPFEVKLELWARMLEVKKGTEEYEQLKQHILSTQTK